jgi:galactosamine-6-phosphate isomerase
MFTPQVFSDHEAMSRAAAQWLVGRLRERPTSLLCLAAGSTPTQTYELLVEQTKHTPSLTARCRLLKLDEWGGVPMDDAATCERQLRTVLVDPLQAADRYVGFESDPADRDAETWRIAQWLQANGPVDVAVLGLGINGHIGFNEPAEALRPHAHVAALSPESMRHEMLTQSDRRPTFGLTLGMADLLQSREVLMLVSGAAKREPLRRLLSGAISTAFPASLLAIHPRVTLMCDELAERSPPSAP